MGAQRRRQQSRGQIDDPVHLLGRWRLLGSADDAQGDAAFVRLADMLAHYSQGSPVSSSELLRAARAVGFGPSELRAVLYEGVGPSGVLLLIDGGDALLVDPTAGGVTVSVTRKLMEQGRFGKDDVIVIAITGNGLKTPEAVKRWQDRGFDVIASTPEEMTAHLNREIKRWGAVFKEQGIKAE